MLAALRLVARHGRWALVAGLAAGLGLPGLAAALKPWIPQLVALLLFLTAFRIGPRAALGSLAEARAGLWVVLAYQLALPLVLAAALLAAGLAHHPAALALVLMASAPAVTGAPNFAIMLGRDPAPALRLLILGTALLPATLLPVLWLMPGIGGPAEVLTVVARLMAVIAAAVGGAFVLRGLAAPRLAAGAVQALDGLAAVVLAVVVVGLMAALGPALTAAPLVVAGYLALVFAANFGLQAAGFAALRGVPGRTGLAIAAGNRNIALFLVALPAATTDPILIFIGCYQLPMFLTPILLRGLYGRDEDQR